MAKYYTEDNGAFVGITIAFIVLIIGDIIGNTLVIVIITRHKSMRTPMNYLLINLALSDMMVAVFIAPRFIFIRLFTHPDGVQGSAVCKLFTGGNLMWTGGAASVFSLVAVSFERYYAVMQPYTHKAKLSIKKVKTVVLVCWTCAFLLNIPFFITIFYNQEEKLCMEKWPQKSQWLPFLYKIIWFIVAGVLPVSTMIVLYSRVIKTLWFKHTANDIESTQLAVVKSRKKVTKMVIIVSIIYPLCWMPYLIVYLLSHFLDGYEYGSVIYTSTVVLVACNSTINPFVYTYQNEKFKKHMNELLCKRWCSLNRVEASTSSSSDKESSSKDNNEQQGHDKHTRQKRKDSSDSQDNSTSRKKASVINSLQSKQSNTKTVGLKDMKNSIKDVKSSQDNSLTEKRDENVSRANEELSIGSSNVKQSSEDSSSRETKRKYSASLSSNGNYSESNASNSYSNENIRETSLPIRDKDDNEHVSKSPKRGSIGEEGSPIHGNKCP